MRPSSLQPVYRLTAPDRHYDLQLLRDLEIANARTRRELGPLLPGGLPVAIKRRQMQRANTSDRLTAAISIRAQTLWNQWPIDCVIFPNGLLSGRIATRRVREGFRHVRSIDSSSL